MLRLLGAVLLVSAAFGAVDPLLTLTDETLKDALADEANSLMLLAIGVEGCEPCAHVERIMRKAHKELRVKANGQVTLAKMTITSQDSPNIGEIVQGQLTIPKLLIFREGEAMDYGGEITKASMVEVMLREVSRSTVQTLSTVKQTERFLHLDSWSSQHADEDKPPRVVGFFPSRSSPGYAVFVSMARKLQGMISFGEVFDPALQKKFMGQAATKTTVRIYKADRRERTLTYGGPLAVEPMARWVATHSLAIVQDLTTESSIEAHMARGVPVFLLLMPDEYEEHLREMLQTFKAVASRVRERLLFAYGFKDTEPWPQFAQSLGIDRGATGAFWMIVGNNMDITGRNWATAWLRPPSLGFQIYAMQARGGEKPADLTEAEVSKFVDDFLAQVDSQRPPEKWEAVFEDEVALDAPDGAASGAGGASGTGSKKLDEEAISAAANHDKELRKMIAALEMSFNSGVANIKKALDDIKDTPQLLPGRTPGLTSTVTSMDMKVKKGLMDLKRKLMDIGRAKKDEL